MPISHEGALRPPIGVKEQVTAQEDQPTLEALFNETLQGKFEQVPAANVLSELPGIESITVFPSPVKGEKSITVVVFYKNEKGRITSQTFSLAEGGGGLVSGRMPKEFPLTRDALSFEVLRIIQNLHVEMVHPVERPFDVNTLDAVAVPDTVEGAVQPPVVEGDVPIFPASDEGAGPLVYSGERGGEGSRERYREIIERYELLMQHPRLLFALTDKKVGLRGYFAAVFPEMVVLENTTLENAAYVVQLDSPIAVSEEQWKMPRDQRFSDEEIERMIGTHLKVIFEAARTRKTLQQQKAVQKIVHLGDWQGRMKGALEVAQAA